MPHAVAIVGSLRRLRFAQPRFVARTSALKKDGAGSSYRPPIHSAVAPAQGVNRLIRVDQLASEVRTPAPPGEPLQLPSRLSPLPPAKNGPPQLV